MLYFKRFSKLRNSWVGVWKIPSNLSINKQQVKSSIPTFLVYIYTLKDVYQYKFLKEL